MTSVSSHLNPVSKLITLIELAPASYTLIVAKEPYIAQPSSTTLQLTKYQK
jgi:hypothetical protein